MSALPNQATETRARVKYGRYGGQFVPETLMPALLKLEAAYLEAGADPLGILNPGTVLDAGNGVTSQQGLGGFHGSYVDVAGKTVYFGVVAYSQGSNGIDFTGRGRDNVTITESHEFDEACTDPDVEQGRLAWYNKKYGEIGDLAVNSGLVPLDKSYVRDAAGYAVQVEWSNADHAFEGVAPKSKP